MDSPTPARWFYKHLLTGFQTFTGKTQMQLPLIANLNYTVSDELDGNCPVQG
jgi:hypothetical protein